MEVLNSSCAYESNVKGTKSKTQNKEEKMKFINIMISRLRLSLEILTTLFSGNVAI